MGKRAALAGMRGGRDEGGAAVAAAGGAPAPPSHQTVVVTVPRSVLPAVVVRVTSVTRCGAAPLPSPHPLPLPLQVRVRVQEIIHAAGALGALRLTGRRHAVAAPAARLGSVGALPIA
jgi:hypothetical protein